MRGSRPFAGALLVSFALTACGPRAIRFERFRDPPEVGATVTAADYPDADAVVLENAGHVRFLDPDAPSRGYVVTETLRARVLTPAGRRLGRVRVYLAPWDTLEAVAARSFDPARPEEARYAEPAAAVVRAAAPEAGVLYSEARLVELDIPSVDVGDVVEHRLVTRREQAFALPRWRFQGPHPTLRSRLTVDVPAGWRLAWGAWDGGARMPLEPRRRRLEGLERLVFEQRDLPARPIEPQSMPFAGARWLELTVAEGPGEAGWDRFGSWDDVGRWYRRLAVDKLAISDAQWRRVTAALGSQPSARRLFELVRDNIRYVQLYEDRLAGFRPHAAREVMARRFGDCKDMSSLLIALMRRAGHAAYPALVGIRDRAFFDARFPSISAFNHVVVATPRPGGGYRFLDPTYAQGDFRARPAYLDGQGALVITATTARPLRIPTRARMWGVDVQYTVVGDETLEVSARLSGTAAAGWAWVAEHDPRRLPRRLHALLPDVALREVQQVRVEAGNGEVQVEASVRVASVVRWDGRRRFIPLAPFVMDRLVRDPVRGRANDVDLGPPGVRRVRVRVPLAPTETVARLPAPQVVEAGAFAHRSTVNRDEGGVTWEAVTVVAQRRVPPAELEALRRMDDQRADAARDAVVLAREGP